MERATFAAGCFWGVEEAFRKVPGVVETCVGYTGGSVINPTYQEVGSGKTGHAEAVALTFDPRKTSYQALLEVFWSIHNPTALRRQVGNAGFQYRSVIFFHTPEQMDAARESKAQLEKSLGPGRMVATEIVPATIFYRAEDYHQRYYERRKRG